MPLIHYCYVLLFWLLASAALGQWAQPGIHDPKGFFFGIPAIFGIILMMLSFAVAPLVLFLGYKRSKLVLHALAYAICLCLEIVLFRLDIQQPGNLFHLIEVELAIAGNQLGYESRGNLVCHTVSAGILCCVVGYGVVGHDEDEQVIIERGPADNAVLPE